MIQILTVSSLSLSPSALPLHLLFSACPVKLTCQICYFTIDLKLVQRAKFYHWDKMTQPSCQGPLPVMRAGSRAATQKQNRIQWMSEQCSSLKVAHEVMNLHTFLRLWHRDFVYHSQTANAEFYCNGCLTVFMPLA